MVGIRRGYTIKGALGGMEAAVEIPALLGGRACLDFVNTVGPRFPTGAPREHLPDYAALVDWAHYAGLLTATQRHRLMAEARADPSGAAATLRAAHRLRDA